MLRRFSEEPTAARRGLQIWMILAAKAASRQTLTYGELATLMGFEGAGVLGQLLDHTGYFCKANDLPLLTVLVVNQDTGRPSKGLTVVPPENFDTEREAVFNYDWFGIEPPTAKELADVYAATPPKQVAMA